MGMFDSLYIKCPKCGNRLEFQSKSGICSMDTYGKNNLPPEVAVGMNNVIVKCRSCKIKFQLQCKIPKRVQVKLIQTKKKEDYDG